MMALFRALTDSHTWSLHVPLLPEFLATSFSRSHATGNQYMLDCVNPIIHSLWSSLPNMGGSAETNAAYSHPHNYHNPSSNAWKIITSDSVGLAIVSLVIALRCYTKLRIVKARGWEDCKWASKAVVSPQFTRNRYGDLEFSSLYRLCSYAFRRGAVLRLRTPYMGPATRDVQWKPYSQYHGHSMERPVTYTS